MDSQGIEEFMKRVKLGLEILKALKSYIFYK